MNSMHAADARLGQCSGMTLSEEESSSNPVPSLVSSKTAADAIRPSELGSSNDERGDRAGVAGCGHGARL
jgi:hypothetical protein